MASITVIPATKHKYTAQLFQSTNKRRAAGYARVSTDSDEQFTSYEAQVDYYTQYILRHSEWEFVKVYTDEGISGTNTRHRDGFNEMVDDALAGKIDLIVTKSVSRFARNTVDSLVTIRKLKEKGVEVFFEKENIYTFDSKGELLLTIMASLAQEESRSISENVTWGQRKRFADGKVSLPYKHFLGYKKGADGLPEIVAEEAVIIVSIYDMFMMGMTPHGIAKQLTSEGIPTPAGKSTWRSTTVENILTNEKYKGDALLQKEFTVDFLEKKMKRNEGEVPQYYVENSHPAIIDKELFDRVQLELARRKQCKHKYSGMSIFASRLVCGDCGAPFGPKVWNSNSKYRRVIWQCNDKFKGQKCTTPHLEEDEIKQRFLVAYNNLILNRKALIEDSATMVAVFSDCSEIETQLEALYQELDVVEELTRRCIAENAITPQRQDAYQQRYNGLVDRHEAAKAQVAELESRRAERLAKATAIEGYAKRLRSQNGQLTEFDDRLWIETIDHVSIYSKERWVFHFLDGSEICG